MILPLLKGAETDLKDVFFQTGYHTVSGGKKGDIARWRGMHYFEKNETGETACVACGLCVAVCPSHCITLEIREREDGSRYPGRYEIDALRCIFCGFCQEACPVNAIKLGQNYEYVHYARKDFLLTKESLLSAKG